uniref:Uncharacterized protein n=1 Tax=Anopheles darlingi TaxID=43151 RepID=A0A2M4D1K3_ANODA
MACNAFVWYLFWLAYYRHSYFALPFPPRGQFVFGFRLFFFFVRSTIHKAASLPQSKLQIQFQYVIEHGRFGGSSFSHKCFQQQQKIIK